VPDITERIIKFGRRSMVGGEKTMVVADCCGNIYLTSPSQLPTSDVRTRIILCVELRKRYGAVLVAEHKTSPVCSQKRNYLVSSACAACDGRL